MITLNPIKSTIVMFYGSAFDNRIFLLNNAPIMTYLKWARRFWILFFVLRFLDASTHLYMSISDQWLISIQEPVA